MDALNILWESREQLTLTSIFAYYVKPNNQKSIFEDNQSDLHSATESLSHHLEVEITKVNFKSVLESVKNKAK